MNPCELILKLTQTVQRNYRYLLGWEHLDTLVLEIICFCYFQSSVWANYNNGNK